VQELKKNDINNYCISTEIIAETLVSVFYLRHFAIFIRILHFQFLL